MSNEEFNKLKIRVDEIYEWMVLTQNKTMQQISKSLNEQMKIVRKLQRRLDQ